MDDPAAYRQWNALRDHENAILQKYSKLIEWRDDQLDAVLDIGCAGGDITNDLILPLLPKTFSRLVGVDFNENMVQFANENYAKFKVSFERLDISGDISEFSKVHDQFDHVISFLCLHLIPDQNVAMRNISKLLKPSGDCLLYIISEHRLFDMYYHLYGKWKKFLPTVDNFISPYYHRVNPVEMLTSFLKNNGFQSPTVEIVKETLRYDDLDLYKAASRSVIPFISRIPSEFQDEFMDDFVQLAMSYNDENTPQNVIVEMPYQFLVAHACKKNDQ